MRQGVVGEGAVRGTPQIAFPKVREAENLGVWRKLINSSFELAGSGLAIALDDALAPIDENLIGINCGE